MISKIKIFLILLIINNNFLLNSQQYNNDLGPDFHKKKRSEFREKMPDNSVAIFFTSPVMKRSNDTNFMYHQNPNFYYLTGWREPHGVLIIYSNQQADEKGKYYEQLYIRERNEYREMWDGKRLGIEGARKMGFDRVHLRSEFIETELDFSNFDSVLHNELRNDVRDNKNDIYDLFDLQIKFEKLLSDSSNNKNDNELIDNKKLSINTKTLNDLMKNLRQTKDKEEIELLKKAVKISAFAQVEVMKAIHNEMTEREVQGIHEYIYRKYGAAHQGYNSIVGSGGNSCVLHYVTNDNNNIKDQLILMDVGAEYRGYTADVTRTIPVNGKFSNEQKEIYNLVYLAQEEGIRMSKVGNSFTDINKASYKIISEGLISLGIINNVREASKYFPHGVSHHIGLDVHDPGDRVLSENMVITVEPGIYIPNGSDCDPKWWNIGVRIEDDILITKNGPINLSSDAPRKIEVIEELMKQKSLLGEFKLPIIN